MFKLLELVSYLLALATPVIAANRGWRWAQQSRYGWAIHLAYAPVVLIAVVVLSALVLYCDIHGDEEPSPATAFLVLPILLFGVLVVGTYYLVLGWKVVIRHVTSKTFEPPEKVIDDRQ